MTEKKGISPAQRKAVHKYEKENYYNPTLHIPKALEQTIKDKATQQDKSISGYIVGLIKDDLGVD